jgi:hypothetical protein
MLEKIWNPSVKGRGNWSLSDSPKTALSWITAILMTAAPAGLARTSSGTTRGEPETPAPILQASFDADEEGFLYADDCFRGTAAPDYADGSWVAEENGTGGALQVTLGGVDETTVDGLSGAWTKTFTLAEPTEVTLWLRMDLRLSFDYELDEYGQALVSVDGVLHGQAPYDYASYLIGDGNLGPEVFSGWKTYRMRLGLLDAGDHLLCLGGYNNRKSASTEITRVLIDDVLLTEEGDEGTARPASLLLGQLDLQRFTDNIETLAAFGDRTQGSQSYYDAELWLEAQLTDMGYEIEEHTYDFFGSGRRTMYVTKVGSLFPDRMFIISGHLDGTGGGGGADDDASGISLVLEAARAFASPGLETDVSLRFVFWNTEETDMHGSRAYVYHRLYKQGLEDPPGSGLYPEPTWLGMISHDMILFDHGNPPLADQIAEADIDIEYRVDTGGMIGSMALADALVGGNAEAAGAYPAEISDQMWGTDSWSFRDHCPSLSVRENTRSGEIGKGSNPHHHRSTDVFATYSEADFLLGFNTMKMTVGTLADVVGARFEGGYSLEGSGCAGTIGTPQLDVMPGESPWLAETFSLEISSIPASGEVFGLVGRNNENLGGHALPLNLWFVGMPDCLLYNDARWIHNLTNNGGDAVWEISLPDDSSLLGSEFYLQALVIDQGANPGNAVVSNAVEAQFGLR